MYVVLLVTVTFYIRDRIGQATFRAIHTLSLLAFVGAALHGMLSGTDTPLTMVKLMYAGTFLSVVFLTTYWLVLTRQKKLLLAQRRL
jgi:DMSO/TMAO reductase YedYZ heme-binding membrane subunit